MLRCKRRSTERPTKEPDPKDPKDPDGQQGQGGQTGGQGGQGGSSGGKSGGTSGGNLFLLHRFFKTFLTVSVKTADWA